MKRVWAALALGILLSGSLRAGEDLTLTRSGVRCDLGPVGAIMLGIPALDGRGTHAPAQQVSVASDGRTLTAIYGAPFTGVSLQMKILEGDKVEYVYTSLPPDLRIVMCGFNLPVTSLVPGLTVSFDQAAPKTIPAIPGKTNKDVALASVNARQLAIKWPSGESLSLTTPTICWHGIQDARVWSKNYISVSLTPPVTRDVPGGDRSTFVLAFAVTRASPAH